jgi:hypothetical protein
LADLSNIHVLSGRCELYREALLNKYCELRDDFTIADLPGRFTRCNASIDCFRARICIPQSDKSINIQKAFYNWHFAGHSIIFAHVGLPDGLVFITGGDAGAKNDPLVLIDNNVNATLQAASPPGGTGLVCLGDAAFGLESNVRPLLKQNMTSYNFYTKEQREALSGVRIAVEWDVGEIKMDEHLVEQFLTLKVHQTTPVRTLRLAALMRNVTKCIAGCNSTTYFGVYPPKLEEYLSW